MDPYRWSEIFGLLKLVMMRTSIPIAYQLWEGFTLRWVWVQGNFLKVPNYIARIDQKHTHGWHVRFPKSPATRFFSDGSFRPPTPESSLEAAKAELLHQKQQHDPHFYAPARGINNKGCKGPPFFKGLVGVRLMQKKNRQTTYYQFGVIAPIWKERCKHLSVTIGNSDHLTQGRIDEKLRLAVACRLMALDHYLKQSNAMRRFSVRYDCTSEWLQKAEREILARAINITPDIIFSFFEKKIST